MRCEYKDDFTVEYSDSLHITKGSGVDFVAQGSEIPSEIKSSLDSAVSSNSCHELRSAAKALTGSITKAFDVE